MLLVPNNTRFWLFNFFSAGSLYWKLIYPSLRVTDKKKRSVLWCVPPPPLLVFGACGL